MMNTFNSCSRSSQTGAALPFVLLLLLIVTILGVASMRGAIMQERMASNTAARGMAFQVAEAGLRQAEIIVRDGTTVTFPTSGCSAGRCAMMAPPATPAWTATGFWTTGAGFQTGTPVPVGSGSVSPRFVIENFGQVTTASSGAGTSIDLGKPPPTAGATQSVFRITSYASTPNGAEVVLQSLYRR